MKINQYKTDIKTGKTAGTEVVYYKTTIVSFTDETITLNTGGWWSRSTKIRMNQASQQFDLGYRVYQTGKDWFVEYGGKSQAYAVEQIYINRMTGEVNPVE